MNIDNLTKGSTADELLTAIMDQETQTEATATPNETTEVEEPKEATEETKEVKVETKPESTETSAPVEATETTEASTEKPTEEYDYKKGYEGLRAWQTKNSQELAEIKKALDTLGTPKESPEAKLPQITPEQIEDAYSRDPVATSRWLAQQEAERRASKITNEVGEVKKVLGNILAESAVNRFRSKYDDFEACEGDVHKAISELPPELVSNPVYFDKVLELGYQAVRGHRSTGAIEAARKDERLKKADKSAKKQEAHVEGSGKTTPEEPLNLKSASSDELFKVMEARGLVKKE